MELRVTTKGDVMFGNGRVAHMVNAVVITLAAFPLEKIQSLLAILISVVVGAVTAYCQIRMMKLRELEVKSRIQERTESKGD